jgi:signal transduction histidine kinase
MESTTKEPVLSLFLASSIHDMKNSVSMLTGSLEKMLSELDPAGFASYDQMAHMLFEVKRVNGNLTQLLALYKVGEKMYPFDPQAHSVAQFAQEIEAQNRSLLDSRRITFYVDAPAELIWHFDEDLIGGVLNHAINNAIRYTDDKIRLALMQIGDFLELRVEDNGDGFPEAMLADPHATSRVNFQNGNTGLGLYFSRHVAQMHQYGGRNGSIRLENGGALGGGCFILQLP